MRANLKDTAAGTFFVAVGLLYGAISLFRLPIGSALNMGPGYFPIFLSILLAFFGALVIMNAFKTSGPRLPFGRVPWRGIAMLSASVIFFATCIEEIGMFPGVFVTTLIASFAKANVPPLTAVASSLGVAAFCAAIFSYGIGLPIPVIGSWLQF